MSPLDDRTGGVKTIGPRVRKTALIYWNKTNGAGTTAPPLPSRGLAALWAPAARPAASRKEPAMPRCLGVLGRDRTVSCASCDQTWSVPYLMRDLGRARLRQEGFAFIWFDDGCIGVNWCPECDRPRAPAVVMPEALLAA